jgi:hypothetical protein
MVAKDSETFFDTPAEEPVVESAEGGEVGEQSEGVAGDENSEQSFIEGTTFRDVKELAKAYKELQSGFTRSSQDLAEAKSLLQQLIPRLKPEQKQEIKDDPDAFMKKFVSDPMGTLKEIITEAQQSIIEPIRGEMRSTSANIELQSFLGKHTELNENDVQPLLKIMERYPEVRSRKDRLEVWLKLLKTENPEIGKRTTQQKEQLEQGVSDAKKAAALGGRKSSTPKQAEGDEFDEVLDLWKKKTSYFRS